MKKKIRRFDKVEPEHEGPIWTHPFMLYVTMTLLIFALMMLVGYWVHDSDMIPNQGINP